MTRPEIIEAHRKQYTLTDKVEGRIKAFFMMFKNFGNAYAGELYRKQSSHETTTIAQDFTEQAYQNRLADQQAMKNERYFKRMPV